MAKGFNPRKDSMYAAQPEDDAISPHEDPTEVDSGREEMVQAQEEADRHPDDPEARERLGDEYVRGDADEAGEDEQTAPWAPRL